MIYQGNCDCGAIQFEVDAPEDLEVENCNCSICNMKEFLHLIVPQPKTVKIVNFDGQNWEQHAHTVAHKSL